MNLITRLWILQNPTIEESIALAEGNRVFLLYALIQTLFGKHWRFRDVETAKKSSTKIYSMFQDYLKQDDFIGADMCRKFLEMGFTRARRYANHKSGRKYVTKPPYYHTGDRGGVALLPQETDALTNEKAQAAAVFKQIRDKAAYHPTYQQMRKEWRTRE
jgi:hypothetical protein